MGCWAFAFRLTVGCCSTRVCASRKKNWTKSKLKRKICHCRMLYEPRPIATLSVDAVSFSFVKTCAFDAIRNRKLNENHKRQRRQSKWIDNPYFMSSICYNVVLVLSTAMALDIGHSNHRMYQSNWSPIYGLGNDCQLSERELTVSTQHNEQKKKNVCHARAQWSMAWRSCVSAELPNKILLLRFWWIFKGESDNVMRNRFRFVVLRSTLPCRWTWTVR